jgi:hypothetical protein
MLSSLLLGAQGFSAQTALASRCTGSGEPPADRPLKYQGSAGALGIKEVISISVSDYSSGKGTLDLHGSGIVNLNCLGKKFTKNNQDIGLDISDCAPSFITLESARYCSEEDKVQVVVHDSKFSLSFTADLKRTDGEVGSEEDIGALLTTPYQRNIRTPHSELMAKLAAGGISFADPIEANLWDLAASSGMGKDAKITVTDNCKSGGCHAKITKIDCPTSSPQPLNFKFGGTAILNEDIADATLEVTAHVGFLKVLDKKLDACGAQTIDLPLGAGAINLNLLNCPEKSGDTVDIAGGVKATQSAPTKIKVDIKARDKAGARVVDLGVEIDP